MIENDGDPVNRPLPSMDQIWEPLMKINIYVEKLQKSQIVCAAQAEIHFNFVDMEKRRKNLKNLSGTTPSI